MNNQITFLVTTYNEERRVEFYLRCIQGHGEIVIIDNYSEDKTLDIARKYTSRIYQHKNPGSIDNEKTMAFILDKVKTKWAYIGQVDEFIPMELMRVLHQIAKSDKYKIVEIYRKNFMFGQEVFNYGKHHLRMFVPESVSFKDNVVHKLGKYMVPKKQVYKVPASENTSIWHFSSYDLTTLERTHNRYADLEAPQRYALGQRFSGVRALFKLFVYFWGTYIGLGGFKGGWPGLFISLQYSYFKFSIEARLWEHEKGLTLDEIEKKYDLMKEKLLERY